MNNCNIGSDSDPVIEQENEWYIGYHPEIPGANGLGLSREECKANLAEAIDLILQDRREDALQSVPTSAMKSTVTIDETNPCKRKR